LKIRKYISNENLIYSSFDWLKKIRERERLIDKEEAKIERKILNALSNELKEKYIRLKNKNVFDFNKK